MADPHGTNSRLIPDSNFGQTFPPDGAAVGAQGTTGLMGPLNLDASGNLLVNGIISVAGTASLVRGTATAAVTSVVTIIASVNSTTGIYVTGLQWGNSAASTVIATLNDSVNSQFIIPAGGGSNSNLWPAPLKVAAGTALTFTLSLAVSTVYVNAQGFAGV